MQNVPRQSHFANSHFGSSETFEIDIAHRPLCSTGIPQNVAAELALSVRREYR